MIESCCCDDRSDETGVIQPVASTARSCATSFGYASRAVAAPQIQLRDATEDDVELIRSLVQELADYETLGHEVVATLEDLRKSLFGPRRFAEVILAEADGDPAGFAVFFHNYSTFLGRPGIYLEDLYVRPKFRRVGIGRLLLTELARLATERGCGRVEWSVLHWNESAAAFYKALGARPMEDWTVFRITGDSLSRLGSAPR